MECGRNNHEYRYQPNNTNTPAINRPITIESDFDTLLRQSKATRSHDHSAEDMLGRSSVTNSPTRKVDPIRLVGESDLTVPSVLGKRKSSERDQLAIGDLKNDHLDIDISETNSFDGSPFTDNNGPISTTTYHEDVTPNNGASPLLRNKTFSNADGHDVDNEASYTNTDGLDWCMSNLESDTPLQQSEINEQEEQSIQNKTLEEFDKLLSTAPPEFFPEHFMEDENTTNDQALCQDPRGKIDNDCFTASHTTKGGGSTRSFPNCSSPGLLQVYSTNSPVVSTVCDLTDESSRIPAIPASNAATGEGVEKCKLADSGERQELLLCEVNGVSKEMSSSESPLFDFDREQDDLQKAMEESLKTQQSTAFPRRASA